MNVAMRAERNEKIDLGAIDSLVKSEAEIATATRQLADFLGNFMNDDLNDEISAPAAGGAHMLAAVDSLSAGKYDTAVLQERDALKELIEGRNKLREEIQKNPSKFRGFAAADRRMAQKLRRPKSDKEEAEEVVRRLKQLASAGGEIETELMNGMQEGARGKERRGRSRRTRPVADADAHAQGRDRSEDPQADGGGDEGRAPMEKPADKGEETRRRWAALTATAHRGGCRAKSSATGSSTTSSKGRTSTRRRQAQEHHGPGQGPDDQANKSLEGANSSLDQGTRPGRSSRSGQARGVLNELAKQVEAARQGRKRPNG